MMAALVGVLGDPSVLLAILAGVVAGMFLGVLPGLTATMGIVLVIPFTYALSTFQAFGVLLGIYVSGLYAGAISAILIRTPGTPAAAATLLDGYPMAQKGEAGRAIGIATFSSFLGGIFSAAAWPWWRLSWRSMRSASGRRSSSRSLPSA
jgi:putative tricarboxylic transport membrane protein